MLDHPPSDECRQLALLTLFCPSGPARLRALGLFAALATVGVASGTLLGGLPTSMFGWSSALLINVPLGLVMAWATRRAGGGTRDEQAPAAPMDWAGAASATLGFGALTLAIAQTSHPTPITLVLWIAAAGLLRKDGSPVECDAASQAIEAAKAVAEDVLGVTAWHGQRAARAAQDQEATLGAIIVKGAAGQGREKEPEDMSAWFRYERHFGRWCPVVFHEEKPRVPKGEEDLFTAAVEVPADCLSTSGEPMFGRLQAKFPAPVTSE